MSRVSAILIYVLTLLVPCGADEIILLGHAEAERWFWVENYSLIQQNLIASLESRVHLNFAGGEISELRPDSRQTLEGYCRSATYLPDQLLLVFSHSVFRYEPDKLQSRFLQAAPAGSEFLAVFGEVDNWRYLLCDHEKKIRLLQNQKLSDEVRVAWPAGRFERFLICSTPTSVLLAFPEAAESLDTVVRTGKSLLIGFSLTDDKVQVFRDHVEAFDLGGLSAVGDEIWLLPREGDRLYRWHRGELRSGTWPAEVAPPATGGRLLATCATSRGPVRLYSLGHKEQVLIHPDGREQKFQMETVANRLSDQEFFTPASLILMGLLAVVAMLRLRQRRLERKMLKFPLKPVPIAPANMLMRALAFCMDILVILAPLLAMVEAQIMNENWEDILEKTWQATRSISLSNAPLEPHLMEIVILLMETFSIKIVIIMVYFVAMEYFFAASVGKFIFHLKLCDDKGGRVTFRAILIKNLLRPLDFALMIPFGLISCLMSGQRKSFGDRAAGTVVAEDRIL